MRWLLIPLLFLGLLVISSCGSSPDKDAAPSSDTVAATVFPGAGWAESSPEEQGVNSAALRDALAYLQNHCKGDSLTETLVIRNGYLIWAGDSIDKVHDIWSCTKSFTSTAVGLMEAEGILSLDQAVADHEPLLQEQYPDATYRHFLTMTSGYNAKGATRWPGDVSEDWSATPYLPAPPLFAPGTEYTYWDEAMIMLGRALTAAADTSLNDYLDERVFRKIGIEKRPWWGEEDVDGVPINFGGTGLRMSASEQARFGWLMLNDGVWDGERILPAGWAATATQNQVGPEVKLADTDRKSTDGTGRYGYNWWVINEGKDAPVAAAFTSGLNHNVCLIIPAWNLVIVRQGVDGNPAVPKYEVYAEVLRRLVGGVF
ncbi:serine hydrolase [Lewinella sp. 4G2]|uniref:serine hydrolase domain-containing protein n=1 Tax=Lewinella sp. 4G2 TaxID=1803372 RepID=UPI0007B492B9|nr:serine hydrolase [Lewinella sp. 4G2]OAV46124.1 hypothetical protein A3850_017850 [Lewinella sp. 4G2]